MEFGEVEVLANAQVNENVLVVMEDPQGIFQTSQSAVGLDRILGKEKKVKQRACGPKQATVGHFVGQTHVDD